MLYLFTDFGPSGPYLGQMEAVLRRLAPGVEIVNLLCAAPTWQPHLASYLLAALARFEPEGSVFLCVVDPGVGGERQPVVLEADGRWFVGPDNGLLNTVAAQAKDTRWQQIAWRPERLSASFHGRDLFAPVAALIALGDSSWSGGVWAGPDMAGWPADCPSIIYCDHYGNAMTGLRYGEAWRGRVLTVQGRIIPQARTFGDWPKGAAFWYANSLNLVEIAANQGRADQSLGLALGMDIHFE